MMLVSPMDGDSGRGHQAGGRLCDGARSWSDVRRIFVRLLPRGAERRRWKRTADVSGRSLRAPVADESRPPRGNGVQQSIHA